MITVIIILSIYLTLGVGFTIASWLQAAEIQSNTNKPIPPLLSSTSLIMVTFWIILAIYCYKAEVKKSIDKIDYNSLEDNDNA